MKYLSIITHYAKVIVISLLFLFFLFLFTECISGLKLVKKELTQINNENKEIQETSLIDIVKHFKKYAHYMYIEKDLNFYFYDSEIRHPAIGKDYKNKNIILAGCSFTWGGYLEYKDTFGVFIAKYFPKYKVYNIGLPGGSPKETLYILRNFREYQNQDILPIRTQKDDVKNFIYMAIFGQKNELFFKHRYRIPSPLYRIQKTKNGDKWLEYYESNNPLYRTFTYSFFVQSYKPPKIFNNYLKNLFTLYIQEIKKEVDKIYPNTTFVLFVYSYLHENNAPEFDLNAIENLGIKVVELNKISKINFGDEKYRTFDNHPNKKAWQEIVPLLGKELNL